MATKNNTASDTVNFEELSAQQSAQIESLTKENAALRSQLAAPANASRSRAELPSEKDNKFKFDGKTYRFTVPAFRHNGQHLTATDALADKNVLEHLISIQSGVIAEIH